MQNSKGMIGLVPRVQVSLFVQVAQQILLVVHAYVAKLVHAGMQSHECVSQVIPNHGSPKNPGKEIPGRDVILQGLGATRRRRRGDVEVDPAVLMGLFL